MSQPDVSIVIVSYNTRELTLACIDSITTSVQRVRPEIIVVDNASRDGSAEAIAARFPEVVRIESATNLGFARGANLGMQKARASALVLLNPDTVVLPGALEQLLDFARAHPEAGIVGGRTLFEDGTLNPTCCFDQPSLWSLFCSGTGLASVFRGSTLLNPELIGGWQRDSVREVGVVTGSFLLIWRELWQQLGGFDERFFMYSEDTDLCLRAWKAGRTCLYTPEPTIVHHGGRSDHVASGKLVKVFRAKAQFMDKHWSRPAARFGRAMLDLHAFGRRAVHAIGLPFARSRERFETWRAVWSQREEWRSARGSP